MRDDEEIVRVGGRKRRGKEGMVWGVWLSCISGGDETVLVLG